MQFSILVFDTAAIWFAVAIGFNFYFVAIVAIGLSNMDR